MKGLVMCAAAAAVCLLSCVESASAAGFSICDAVAGNLVANCGFETGNFSSWTQFGNTGATGVGGSSVNSGSFAADFGPVGSTGGIFQDILTSSTVYNLSFYLANDGGTPSSFDVSWGGVSQFSQTNAGGFAYQQLVFNNLSGQNTSTRLQFTFRNDPSFYHLDDVVVTAVNAAPEPGTAGLLMTGFGGMVWLVRRRSSRLSYRR